MDVTLGGLSRIGRLATVLIVGVLVFVALAGSTPARSALDECAGAGCEGDDVALVTTAGAPLREQAPACLRDARCAGAHDVAAAGLALAALAGALILVLAAGPRRAGWRARTAVRPWLFGRQLYRPPRFA